MCNITNYILAIRQSSSDEEFEVKRLESLTILSDTLRNLRLIELELGDFLNQNENTSLRTALDLRFYKVHLAIYLWTHL